MTLSTLRQNIRVAVRSLLKQRVFSVAAVVSLGVAIAVNTTMYSLFDAMLNPRIAGVHPERMYTLRYFGNVARSLSPEAISSALRTGLRSYEGVTGYRWASVSMTVEAGGRVRDARVVQVRPDFFSVMSVPVLEGRAVASTANDGVASVVLSDRLRAQLFPNDTPAVGAAFSFDGRPGRVAAVTHQYAGFDGLDAEAWVIETEAVDQLVPVNLIRLRAGFDIPSVERELATVAARLAVAAGESARETRFVYRPITQQFRAQGLHYALVGAVLAVLLVACANLSNLQFARGLDRARELAVRASLGATRRDLVVMLLTESGVLAVAGLALGVLLTLWAITLLGATIPREVADYVIAPHTSWQMLVVAAAAAIVCLLLIGLVPALRLSAVNLNMLIKSGAGTGAHRANRVKYGILLVAQISLTLPLVSGAVLLAQAARQYEDPMYRATRMYGHDPDSIVMARVQLAAPRGARVPVASLAASLVGRARAIDNVSEAGVVFSNAPSDGAVTAAAASGETVERPALLWNYSLVSPGYFRAIGFPIERGRDFTDGVYAQPSVIVDRASATYFWPNQNPVGQRLKLGSIRSAAPWLPIIGVAGDHFDQVSRTYMGWLDTLKLKNVYRVIAATDSVTAGSRGYRVTLYARVTRDPLVVALRLRQALGDMNTVAPPRVAWLRDEYGITRMIVRRRFMTSLFAGGAAICLALAAFGIYAIVAQSVAQRRREIAVRVFLGATPRGILGMILREGNVFVLGGIAVGLLVTGRTVGWLGTLLATGVTGPWDTGALSFAGVCALVFIVAALAALVPAVLATRVSPAEALRAE
jgi:predicted permease